MSRRLTAAATHREMNQGKAYRGKAYRGKATGNQRRSGSGAPMTAYGVGALGKSTGRARSR